MRTLSTKKGREDLLNYEFNRLENQVLFNSTDQHLIYSLFVCLINKISRAKNISELKYELKEDKFFNGMKDYFFFYYGSTHLAVHQKIDGKTLNDRLLIVEF